MKLRSTASAIVMVSCLLLAGCMSRQDPFMGEPRLSPVGSGLGERVDGAVDTRPTGAIVGPHPKFDASDSNLYQDPRITKVGDIVRVLISINDKATLDNSTNRSQTAKSGIGLDWTINPSGASTGSPSAIKGDISSDSLTQGQGNIDRAEQIQVSVAAVVTQVLPNGNLVISGTQEVRVNYELRQLTVAGIVRPWDISPDNSISYDRIAEARISYGGRGRLNDVQQPSWGQQLYDRLKPY